MTLLEDGEWGQWSDHEIARQCAVARSMVTKYRGSLVTETSEDPPPPLNADQQSRIDEIQYQLSEGNITRDDANEQIAEIDPDWHKRASGKRTYTTKHGTTATMDISRARAAPSYNRNKTREDSPHARAG